MVKISAAIPSQLRDGLEQSARENDRSMSAEVRRALTEYLTSPPDAGSRVPAESRTLSSHVGAGGSHSDLKARAVGARQRDSGGAA